MANSYQWTDILDLWLRDRLRHVHTWKPAIVLAVNGNRLDARILTKTAYAEKQDVQPDVVDVPYQIISAKKGSVKITLPVSVGDNVMIAFSDRDFGNLMDLTDDELTQIQTRGDGQTLVPEADDLYTHRYEAIYALPSWFTIPEEIEVDSDKIVIQNQSTSVTVAPDGTIEMKGTNLIVDAPSTTFKGEVQIDSNLNVSGKSTASDHVSGGIKGKTHTHTAPSGGGTTTPPL